MGCRGVANRFRSPNAAAIVAAVTNRIPECLHGLEERRHGRRFHQLGQDMGLGIDAGGLAPSTVSE